MRLIIVIILLIGVTLITIGVAGIIFKNSAPEPKAQVNYCQELTQGRMPEVCK